MPGPLERRDPFGVDRFHSSGKLEPVTEEYQPHFLHHAQTKKKSMLVSISKSMGHRLRRFLTGEPPKSNGLPLLTAEEMGIVFDSTDNQNQITWMQHNIWQRARMMAFLRESGFEDQLLAVKPLIFTEPKAWKEWLNIFQDVLSYYDYQDQDKKILNHAVKSVFLGFGDLPNTQDKEGNTTTFRIKFTSEILPEIRAKNPELENRVIQLLGQNGLGFITP